MLSDCVARTMEKPFLHTYVGGESGVSNSAVTPGKRLSSRPVYKDSDQHDNRS